VNLAPHKCRAWDYALTRGFITAPQAREALDFGLSSSEEPTLREIREALIRESAKADRAGDTEARHNLLLALAHVDDARNA
jgi:hypothetical protein